MAKSVEVKSDLNPVILDVLFYGFRIVAQMLKELGVLPDLEKKAAATKNELDDKAMRIVNAILEIMAE